MTVSPDDRSVYQATDDQSNAGLAVFARTPAVLTGLSVLPHRTSLAGRKVTGRCVKPTKHNRHAKHCRRPIKLRIGYTLNGATTVTFTLKRRASGRRVKGRCVKRTQKNKKHPRCTRVLSVAGAISRTGIAGANQFTWRGKIGGHTLGPGTYELTAAPLDGLPGKTTFKITR
jgi:hypothetical protein